MGEDLGKKIERERIDCQPGDDWYWNPPTLEDLGYGIRNKNLGDVIRNSFIEKHRGLFIVMVTAGVLGGLAAAIYLSFLPAVHNYFK